MFEMHCRRTIVMWEAAKKRQTASSHRPKNLFRVKRLYTGNRSCLKACIETRNARWIPWPIISNEELKSVQIVIR